MINNINIYDIYKSLHFYDMVKTCLIMVNNVNIYTTYKSLPQNVIRVLSTTYLNKTRVPEKSFKFQVKLAKVSCIKCAQAISRWFLNWLRFYDKMDFPIRMRITYITRHHHTICLKVGDTFLNSLVSSAWSKSPVSVLQSKKISFYIVVSFRHLLSLS